MLEKDVGGDCVCVVDASTATAKLTAIGLTELCDPPV
jgi:hypothetical protein